jgi:hypothetical protein
MSGTMCGMERDYGEHLIHALELVQRDVDATAVEPHRMHFVSVPGGGGASDDRIFLAIEDGSYWSGGSSCFGDDESTAVASVADTAQDCLIEVTGQVWPVCPDHDKGLAVRDSDGSAVHARADGAAARSPTWWCNAIGGHSVSAIGSLHRRT